MGLEYREESKAGRTGGTERGPGKVLWRNIAAGDLSVFQEAPAPTTPKRKNIYLITEIHKTRITMPGGENPRNNDYITFFPRIPSVRKEGWKALRYGCETDRNQLSFETKKM